MARFVAPQDFSAAFRVLPWASLSSASAWSSRASWKMAWMRSVLAVMSSCRHSTSSPVLSCQNGQSRDVLGDMTLRPSWAYPRRNCPAWGRHGDSEAGSRGLILPPAGVVHEAVEARAGLQLVPAQLRRALGEAGSASFLEAPLPHPSRIEDRPVVRVSRHLALADLVPVQELVLHVAVGIQFAGVDLQQLRDLPLRRSPRPSCASPSAPRHR